MPTDTPAHWALNETALAGAVSFLGLERHAAIYQESFSPLSEGIGLYSWPELSGYSHHYVSICKHLAPEDASAALWHELWHAFQYEAMYPGDEWEAAVEAYNAFEPTGTPEQQALAYAQLTTEREAYEAMNYHFTQGSLCDPHHTPEG